MSDFILLQYNIRTNANESEWRPNWTIASRKVVIRSTFVVCVILRWNFILWTNSENRIGIQKFCSLWFYNTSYLKLFLHICLNWIFKDFVDSVDLTCPSRPGLSPHTFLQEIHSLIMLCFPVRIFFSEIQTFRREIFLDVHFPARHSGVSKGRETPKFGEGARPWKPHSWFFWPETFAVFFVQIIRADL